ncbi:hypothetical protein RHSIM_RhsimUnG0172500 [Rhododendron simsii]|uniref:Uncharacterized protein n=1 Tax=Rhododendron simsii TaxID=118357 RepID=A0A834FUF7_RHOSS|nr:hypothetical protein RHSIM_RhsimUnG0172500 [Rhododendron simsii]
MGRPKKLKMLWSRTMVQRRQNLMNCNSILLLALKRLQNSQSKSNVGSSKEQNDLSGLQGERPGSESESRGYVMINDLQPYDRDWTIKVLVLRRGLVEPYSNTKGPGTMWKVILMDEQCASVLSLLLIDCLSVLHTKGTGIQAVNFNDVIDKLEYLFLKERTYLVSNGLVKPTNHRFPSVHKEIEMTPASQAYVEDAKIGIELDKIKYHIIPFMEIKHHAKNDSYIGDILEDMAKERPIVALSKLKTSAYGGLLSISTLSITTLQVNPKIPEADTIRQWYNENGSERSSNTMVWEIDKQSVRVKIEDLIERPLPDFEV